MVSLGKGDEASDRKQIDRDQQRDRESWEARLHFENEHEMLQHDEEMCSDNRPAPKQQLSSEIGTILRHKSLPSCPEIKRSRIES